MEASPAPVDVSQTNRDRIEAEFPGLIEYLEPWLSDFDEQLANLVWPRWRSPLPRGRLEAQGSRFDLWKVDRFIRFALKLRHVKGSKFAGEPFIPDLWQIVHIIAPVFGWVDSEGRRLFTEVYVEVPRKNGKSTLVAAIGLYLLVSDGESGAEVYSVAKDRDQARAVFAVAAIMALHAPALRERLRIPPNPLQRGDKILYPATASVWGLLAKDRKGGKHHGLNVHAALIDELHTIVDAELLNTIETGTGSREQPLIIIITTAGIESESPLWADRRALAIRIAGRDADVPHAWAVIFAADPKAQDTDAWKDPATWRSANPGYGRSVRPEYLAKRAAKAMANPSELDSFLRLHLGIPTEAASDFLELRVFDRSAGLVIEEELVGATCYGGLDLSSSRDLTAAVFVFPDGHGSAEVVCRFWIPGDNLTERANRDRANYPVWAREGFIIPTPGETIDYDLMEAELVAFAGNHTIKALNYDRWGAKQIRQHLEAERIEIWELGQGYASMSAPTKETARLLTESKLRHGGHPVLRHCASGFRVVSDPAGNVKPDKKSSTSRIDGMVALIMAVDAWHRDLADTKISAYEDRGVEVAG